MSPFDTTTLNYNWQMNQTNAFSVYSSATDKIERRVGEAGGGGGAALFTRMRMVRYQSHSGYIATVIEEGDRQRQRPGRTL